MQKNLHVIFRIFRASIKGEGNFRGLELNDDAATFLDHSYVGSICKHNGRDYRRRRFLCVGLHLLWRIRYDKLALRGWCAFMSSALPPTPSPVLSKTWLFKKLDLFRFSDPIEFAKRRNCYNFVFSYEKMMLLLKSFLILFWMLFWILFIGHHSCSLLTIAIKNVV